MDDNGLSDPFVQVSVLCPAAKVRSVDVSMYVCACV
jgi:hypothetical protein